MKLDTLQDLEQATLQWSYDRGILTNGKATTQALKLMSEASELARHLHEDVDIKDDVGDCLVVLTNLANLTKTSLSECNLSVLESKKYEMEDFFERSIILNFFTNLGNLCDNVAKGNDIKQDIQACLISLNDICNFYELDPIDCWLIAYTEIKDRKGFLNEHGNFIKSTDKNYPTLFKAFKESQQ